MRGLPPCSFALCPPAFSVSPTPPATPPPPPPLLRGHPPLQESLEPDPPLAGVAPLPSGHFEAAAATWEKGLKWRLVMRPGGAYVSPPDWYRLYAAAQQAEAGDNPLAEAPMWAENGGIDFGARAQWDAWDGLRGWDRPRAVALFCRAYAEARAGREGGRGSVGGACCWLRALGSRACRTHAGAPPEPRVQQLPLRAAAQPVAREQQVSGRGPQQRES